MQKEGLSGSVHLDQHLLLQAEQGYRYGALMSGKLTLIGPLKCLGSVTNFCFHHAFGRHPNGSFQMETGSEKGGLLLLFLPFLCEEKNSVSSTSVETENSQEVCQQPGCSERLQAIKSFLESLRVLGGGGDVFTLISSKNRDRSELQKSVSPHMMS